jgi:hypothetical protein
MATYRALVLKGKGGLDQLEVVEQPEPEPKPGEAPKGGLYPKHCNRAMFTRLAGHPG